MSEPAGAAGAEIEGWLTDAQADRLRVAASAVAAPGRIVEIGSFRGRSTVVLASAAAPGVEVVAIDPYAGSDRGPRELARDVALGDEDLAAFLRHLADAGVSDRVRQVRLASGDALDAVSGAVDVLYVDGAHRLRPALADLAGWGARVRPGGRMLVHDAFSSVGVTLALLIAVTPSARWRYLGRAGSLAEYARHDVRGPARARSVVAQLTQVPWFWRNLAVKVLIVARLHRGPWPY